MSAVREVADYIEKYFQDEYGMTLAELKQLAELKRDGKMIELPCKPGDTIYQIEPNRTIKGYRVANISVEEWGLSYEFYVDGFGAYRTCQEEPVYFSYEEAESKLKEIKNDK